MELTGVIAPKTGLFKHVTEPDDAIALKKGNMPLHPLNNAAGFRSFSKSSENREIRPLISVTASNPMKKAVPTLSGQPVAH